MAMTRVRRRWLLGAVPLLGAGIWCGLAALSFATSLRLYSIPSGSMSPALAPGDKVCVDTQVPCRPNRGEVWIFTSPSGSAFVKRVIGQPGDMVEIRSGKVSINGTPLDESYLAATPAGTMSPLRLGKDEFFMLGDNRGASLDSRALGPVPRRMFVGRVVYRYWPTARLGGLK